MRTLPAGWYPDPDDVPVPQQRYFDGNDWIDHTAPYPPIDPYQQQMLAIAEANYRGARRIRRLFWSVLIGIVGIFVLIVLIAFITSALNV